VPGRPLLVASIGLALTAPVAATDAATTPVATRTPPVLTAVEAPPLLTPYELARTRGQPVAVLTRSTVLRTAPRGQRLWRVRQKTDFGTPTVLAVVDERGGWLRVMEKQLPNGRTGWIKASAAGIVNSPWSMRADLSERLVEVFRDGRVVRRIRVGIGKPTTPTPLGRFAVTDKLHYSSPSPAYGCCVLGLTGRQPLVPSQWPDGLRMAIHGTNDPGTIGAPASLGCLRASESDMRWLVRRLYLGSILTIQA
jgi:lipoprotein-anchoring transpeptidase ErfK/SrfK